MSDADSELRVAHLDADAFYVSVELRRHPELRGKPVVVSGTGPRAVVTTASYEARRFGVGSAMPASRARRLCPEAVFLAPDFTTYRAASEQVMDLVRAHVERVEIVGLDEAYLDVAGLYSPRAAMRRLLAEIKSETQLTCSVGLGPEQARRQGRIRRREARRLRRAHARAGVRALRLLAARAVPASGPKTAARLAEMGLSTSPRSPTHPSELLVERFGPNLGRDSARRGRFEHDGEIGAARKVVSESRERTFDTDVSDAGADAGAPRR